MVRFTSWQELCCSLLRASRLQAWDLDSSAVCWCKLCQLSVQFRKVAFPSYTLNSKSSASQRLCAASTRTLQC